MDTPRPTVRILCGPTGAGKTEVALICAERLNAHIISLDAMKVYRGMDIGTAKPTPDELSRVKHHMLSFLEPSESSSMGRFLDRVETHIRDLHARGIPIICDGGSIMYVKGLVEGVFDGPGRDDAIRAVLKRRAETDGVPSLHKELERIDPDSAARIGVNDYKRIERALEVFTLTGKPISQLQTQWGVQRSDIDIRLVGIRRERNELYARINARTPAMLDAGWIDEARALLKMPLSDEARMAHGYRAVFAYIRGEISRDDMIDSIQKDTRHYAKRQLSWFSKFPGIRWVDAQPDSRPETLADTVMTLWDSQMVSP